MKNLEEQINGRLRLPMFYAWTDRFGNRIGFPVSVDTFVRCVPLDPVLYGLRRDILDGVGEANGTLVPVRWPSGAIRVLGLGRASDAG